MDLKPHEVTIGIAIASLIVIPLIMSAWKKLVSWYKTAQDAALSSRLKEYVTRSEMEMQFDTLTDLQNRQHAENQRFLQDNQSFLDTIRTEALRREEKIITLIKETGDHSSKQNDRIQGEVHKVNTRVDSVLQMLGDRRQRPR